MNDHHLTLQQAAKKAGCSTKTLYRLMNKEVLPFQRGADNRRYIDSKKLSQHFNLQHAAVTTLTDETSIEKKIESLMLAVERQTQLLECMISLYQPKTMKELADKRSLASKAKHN